MSSSTASSPSDLEIAKQVIKVRELGFKHSEVKKHLDDWLSSLERDTRNKIVESVNRDIDELNTRQIYNRHYVCNELGLSYQNIDRGEADIIRAALTSYYAPRFLDYLVRNRAG